MINKNIVKITGTFKLLSSPTRLKILKTLFKSKDEMCVNEIAESVGMSHSAVSHQLAKLEAREIVYCERRGKTMCYQIQKNPTTKSIEKAISLFV
jgi:ArsR family transcriptional regulator